MNQIYRSALVCAVFSMTFSAAHAATFTVTNTNDSGAGSLRKAIADAVAAPTAAHDNVVVFNIPGDGVHTIRPTSPLPPIKDLTIDGYTQPGSQENTRARGSDAVLTIEIDGSLAGAGAHGLVNEGAVQGAGVPNATVRGLVINRFSGAGIHVTGPGGTGFPGYVTVRGCYIGTDASGTQARGNGIGIELGTDAQVMIGEPTPDFGGNTVPWPAYRNLISGNVGAGVKFDSADAQSPAFGTVRGAYIGTDAGGTAALGNGGDGVAIGPGGAVGSAGFGSFIYLHDNLISANMGDGIDTQGIGTQAVGNTIGAGSDGRALGNQGNGAYFHGASAGALNAAFPQVGAIGPGVSNNTGAGVLIADSAIVDVSGRFTANVGLGIDLDPAGPDTNDVGDIDAGPNDRLNYPVITSAVSDGVSPGSRVQGTIHSKPNAQIQVLLYSNATCNSSGYGEAARFLNSSQTTTDGSGNATFDAQLNFPIDTAFPFVVAQSRRSAESASPLPSMFEVSEYSACYRVTGPAPLPTLSINDASVNEGNAGTTTATFTVTLSAAAASAVTVSYATSDVTAAAGSDYTASSGALTFAIGETTKTVNVAISGDTTVEPNETFALTLSAASGATLADAQGLGTIVNDDIAPPPVLPTLSIGDVSVIEGNAGTSTATFTVTLSAAAASAVTANYSTANGTATAGSDYVAGSGALSFAIGETTKTVAITINGDTVVEPDETFHVDLAGASGATIADAQGQGTITNDDAVVAPTLPALSINDVTVNEGDGGGSRTDAAFTVTLSAASLNPVTVTVSTLNSAGFGEGTAHDNGPTMDYGRHTETLTFAPGQTSLPVVITVINDRNIERPRIEDFTVFLRDATGATIDRARGQGKIVDDDGPPFGGAGALDAWMLAMLGLCVFSAVLRTRGSTSARRVSATP